MAEMVLGQYVADLPTLCKAAARLVGEESASKLKSAAPFNALISGFCKSGQTKKSATLMRQMRSLEISPTARTFTPILKSLAPSEVNQALKILHNMIATPSIQVTTATLNVVLDLCFRAGPSYREPTMQVFSLLQKSPEGPNADTVLILLNQCRSGASLQSVYRDAEKWGLGNHPKVQAEILRTAFRVYTEKREKDGDASSNPLSAKAALPKVLDWANRFTNLGRPLHPESVDVILGAYAAAGAAVGGLSFADKRGGRKIRLGALIDLLRAVGRDAENDGVDRRDERVAWRAWDDLMKSPNPLATETSQKTVAAIIEALGRSGDVRGVWRLYRTLSPSPTTATATPPSTLTPLPPLIARAFLRAFGARLASDPRAAAAVFAASFAPPTPSFQSTQQPDTRALFDLLSAIRTRQDALHTLSTFIALAIRTNIPLTTPTLARAFAMLLDRAREPGTEPMAFSPARELEKVGVWDGEGGRKGEWFVEAARQAVVLAAAKGVAGVAEVVRDGTDVGEAVGVLERWVEGKGVEPEGNDVEDVLGKLERWVNLEAAQKQQSS
ncbi:hypothetical protein HK104_004026 [Borealophlyctis nickersoniae]|nr:hypothetical protein HK104_004026 [Borealophlyctis nickersoniae]